MVNCCQPVPLLTLRAWYGASGRIIVETYGMAETLTVLMNPYDEIRIIGKAYSLSIQIYLHQ